jgi:hypothetical protein
MSVPSAGVCVRACARRRRLAWHSGTACVRERVRACLLLELLLPAKWAGPAESESFVGPPPVGTSSSSAARLARLTAVSRSLCFSCKSAGSAFSLSSLVASMPPVFSVFSRRNTNGMLSAGTPASVEHSMLSWRLRIMSVSWMMKSGRSCEPRNLNRYRCIRSATEGLVSPAHL